MSHVPHSISKGPSTGASDESGSPRPEGQDSPPRRTILVDGFNVLHAVLLGKDRDGRWWRQELREQLLDRVTLWQGAPADIWVAFDGARPHVSVWAEPVAMPSGPLETNGDGTRPRFHSVFVESADDWIVRRSRRAEHPERIVVVSADRKVAGRARSAGCEILTPWAFMARCPTGASGPADDSRAPAVSESPLADTPSGDAPGSADPPGEPVQDEIDVGPRLLA